MTDKKYTNPIMTPEWFESLIEACNFPPVEELEKVPAIKVDPEDCAGIPVIPPNEMGDADIPACVEDAKALQGAYEVEMSEDEYKAFCARARGGEPVYGGGGLSPCAIECMDFYNRVEIWLDNGLVTKHEIGEFAESLFRLIRK